MKKISAAQAARCCAHAGLTGWRWLEIQVSEVLRFLQFNSRPHQQPAPLWTMHPPTLWGRHGATQDPTNLSHICTEVSPKKRILHLQSSKFSSIFGITLSSMDDTDSAQRRKTSKMRLTASWRSEAERQYLPVHRTSCFFEHRKNYSKTAGEGLLQEVGRNMLHYTWRYLEQYVCVSSWGIVMDPQEVTSLPRLSST